MHFIVKSNILTVEGINEEYALKIQHRGKSTTD